MTVQGFNYSQATRGQYPSGNLRHHLQCLGEIDSCKSTEISASFVKVIPCKSQWECIV